MTTHRMIEPVHHGETRSARLTVYGIHGRAQSPEFMIEQAERIGVEGVHWVLPAAEDNSWYPSPFMEEVEENQPRLDDALDTVGVQLGALLVDAQEAGGPPVVVFGFSQGACLLAEYLLRNQPRVDGIVLHTGGYMGPVIRSFEPVPPAGLHGAEIVMFTASQDPWVPLHRSEETRDAFQGLGASVGLEVYEESEHHINDAAVSRIRSYLEARVLNSV